MLSLHSPPAVPISTLQVHVCAAVGDLRAELTQMPCLSLFFSLFLFLVASETYNWLPWICFF